MVAPLLAGTVAVGTICFFVFAVFIADFPEARPWRAQRGRLMALASEYGLTPNDEGRTATGNLAGMPFSIGISTVKGSKATTISLWAKLELTDCPETFRLSEESVMTGMSKAFGGEELSLGLPEFDAVFLIQGNCAEEIREFLTPEVQAGLLQYLPELPEGEIRNGAVWAGKRFSTPLFMTRHFRPLLDDCRGMAGVLSGETASESDAPSRRVEKKLASFVKKTLPCWVIATVLGATIGPAVAAAFGIGVLLSGFALTGTEWSRTLLQGYYAFITVAVGCLILLGIVDGLELYNVRWLRMVDEQYVPYFVGTTVTAIFSWGSRHYLKSLDRLRVASPSKPISL